MDSVVYFDNAATTKIKAEVLDSMMLFLTEDYANPSSSYPFAQKSKIAIETARNTISSLINCKSNEIFFTSGGTESDNWAIKCVAENYSNKGKHIITSKIEHHAVLHTVKWLETRGFEITYLDVDENGIIRIEELEKAIRPDTILISIMAANNEIGTIQPLKEIGTIARKHKVLFHTDAVQAYGHIPIDVSKMKIDLLSASGHKIHGPKGVGVLYVKSGIKIGSFLHGGAQENGHRASTYNVPGIVGMGKASELALTSINCDSVSKKRDRFINTLISEIPYCYLNGDSNKRLPNNISISFEFVDAESLLVMLNQYNICASVGSACTTGQIEPSHVLKALGLDDKRISGTVRFSISDETTDEEIDFVIAKLKECIDLLRSRSSAFKKRVG